MIVRTPGQIHFISAGAGSGKTFRITEILFAELAAGQVRPEAVVATTFTKKAANELVERVRMRLAENQRHELAASLGQSMIGTVNSVCGRILSRYAFEAGLSPQLEVLDEESGRLLFSQALEQSFDLAAMRRMNALAARLGQYNWKGEVKRVVDMARANNIPPAELASHASDSVKEYLAFFPKPKKRDFNTELIGAINQAIKEISANIADGDATKKTNGYLGVLHTSVRDLKANRLTWSQWVKLSKEIPAKKSQDSSEAVIDIALNYDRHPDLYSDLNEWTTQIFSLAAQAMDSYDIFKAERGLMDFVDQEQKVLQLLDLPEVVVSLQEELDLLLVDEFQDTSPIQLAVFLKLAELAKKTVWVGDVKQSIYGFRGCDPELMNAVVNGVRSGGQEVEILSKSWRSRPALVNVVNALFVPAFAEMLDEKEVRLTAAHPEVSQQSAVEFWQLQGRNQGLRAGALANGIKQLFNDKRQLVDKESRKLRPIRFNDIAVLSRTNSKATEYAKALSQLGLPVALAQHGLLGTPEGVLSLACLRYLADADDSLAAAEIVALHGSMSPEEWLNDRLQHLAAGETSRSWGVDGALRHPVLLALQTQRQQLDLFSPSEALASAIWSGDVERIVLAWGPNHHRAEQRLSNIEALQALAVEYEDTCRQKRSAATIGGLILWLQDLHGAELDTKGVDPDADAIHVLTHHGAKGLEWPVVVCADLETKVRPGIWGLNMVNGCPELDLTNPLAERRLSYWVWPFGRQAQGIAVADTITASIVGQRDVKIRTEEAKRLLYVSLTRARDLLIMPLAETAKKAEWLDTLGAAWLPPAAEQLVLPNGETVPSRVVSLEASDVPATIAIDNTLPWFPARKDRSAKLNATICPSSLPAVTATCGQIIPLGKRIPLAGKPHMDQLGTALHDIIAADLAGGFGANREERATLLLQRYQLQGNVTAADVLQRSGQLKDWLEQRFDVIGIYPEWPIQSALENSQRLKGWVDLLVETTDGWIIIDHKSFPGKQADWQQHALEYSGQLQLYRQAIEAATGKAVLSQWIHFCVGGGLVEVIV